jgi:hypothetical protein
MRRIALAGAALLLALSASPASAVLRLDPKHEETRAIFDAYAWCHSRPDPNGGPPLRVAPFQNPSLTPFVGCRDSFADVTARANSRRVPIVQMVAGDIYATNCGVSGRPAPPGLFCLQQHDWVAFRRITILLINGRRKSIRSTWRCSLRGTNGPPAFEGGRCFVEDPLRP